MADPFSFTALWRAYRACRRRKAATPQAQRYALRLLDQLHDTAQALQQRCYTPARSLCFIARQPKAREIHAAAFADRVVHHALVPHLEVLYEPIFIHDLYSNRKHKGTHAAVARLQHFMRQLREQGRHQRSQPAKGPAGIEMADTTPSAAGQSEACLSRPQTPSAGVWYLQLDIHNFFVSINRRILFDLIRKTLNKKYRGSETHKAKLRWLTRRLLTGNPAQSAIACGHPADFARVPPHKRLSNAPPEHGLPIGNLTSQFFANVYLNELDQFVKHHLRCRHYLRYVDDFILLHHDPAQLLAWRLAINDFLAQRLGLRLKAQSQPRPITAGADFLGYIVRADYCLVRRRVVGNLYQALLRLERQLFTQPGWACLTTDLCQRIQATLASYLGHFRHANHQRLVQQVWQRFAWLESLFQRQGTRLLPRWQARSAHSFAAQWRHFQALWPSSLIVMQRGARCYVLNDQALWLQQLCRFPLNPTPCPGFQRSLSIPFPLLWRLLADLRRQRLAYVLVLEEGYLPGGLKQRRLREWFLPTLQPQS